MSYRMFKMHEHPIHVFKGGRFEARHMVIFSRLGRSYIERDNLRIATAVKHVPRRSAVDVDTITRYIVLAKIVTSEAHRRQHLTVFDQIEPCMLSLTDETNGENFGVFDDNARFRIAFATRFERRKAEERLLLQVIGQQDGIDFEFRFLDRQCGGCLLYTSYG